MATSRPEQKAGVLNEVMAWMSHVGPFFAEFLHCLFLWQDILALPRR